MAIRTVCPYCGVGCGLLVEADGGRLTRVKGDPAHPVNRGRTCRKPLELPAAVHASDRLTAPMKRSAPSGGYRATGWAEALSDLASRLQAIGEEHGPDSIGFYISGQLLTEDYYAINKLVKGFIGTNNVDSNSRLCMSSAVAGYKAAFGHDGPPGSYADIEAADCFLLLGSNAAACHPILWSRIRDRQREGAFVITVDPRPTATSRGSDLHLPVKPGTDLPLLNAMLGVIADEGLLDREFIDAHVSGFDGVLASAREWPVQRAAEVCGVRGELIVEAAHRFGGAGAATAMWSMGANQSTVGTLKNRALINLCLATGNLGRPGAGPFSLTGQPNAMGGREVGGLAHLLPGYRHVIEPADRAEVAELWRLPDRVPGISGKPGLPAVELFEAAAAGRVKALWIVATNPVVSMPDSSLVREALRRAELVVVQDAHHPTETSAFADYLLPAAAWPEKQGTMTNSERRVGLVRRAVPPPGEAQPDWRIFAGLASAMGFGEWFDWEDEAAVYAEYVRLTAGRPCDVSGLTHARLARAGDGVQWPCPEAGHPGSERLHLGGVVGTPDGRAVAAVTPHREPAEPPDRDFPLILTTGRIADQWHTMTRTGKSAALRAAAGEPQLEIGPDDARVHGISDGGWVLVRSRRGELRLRAKIVAGLARGVVFAPFHWGALHAEPGAGALNATTAGAVDPISKQPELKFVAVALEPIATPRAVRSADSRTLTRLTKELLIVGSGMAGLAVAEEVIRRRAPAEWHVTLIGAEPAVPYNRIMVSQLLAGSASPEQLALRPAQWFNENRVRLAPGVSVESIDVEGRAVIDSRGRRFRYDALVLATGSRPMVPPVPGAELPHVHAFRTIADVDALLGGVAGGGRRAVVVGGGLLGLEAAAGLQARGAAAVTVVERADRLMPQQLDAGAAALLRRAIEQRGVALRLGCSVAAIEPEQLTLDDGELLSADLVVMAAGVVPAIELARRSGLRCARGVLVDDELRTSAPDVWAVGECAEHRGSVYALWAPLAEQARIAGAVVVGEPGAFAGAATATTLKVGGIELFAGGVVDAGDGIDEVVMSDTRSGRYRRLLLDGDRLVGAILLGDCAGAPRLQTLLRTGEPIRAEAVNGLLTSGAAGPSGRAGKPDPEEIVCSCNGVTRGTLCGAIAQGGLTSVAALGEATRAGTGCGSCKGELQALISSAGNTGDHLAKPAAGTIAA